MKAIVIVLLISALFVHAKIPKKKNYQKYNQATINQKLLLDKLKEQAKSLSVAYPPSYANLISGLIAYSEIKMDSLLKKDFQFIETRYKLPKELVKQIEPILFTGELRIVSIPYVHVQTSFLLEEYVFAAYNEGEYFRFAYAKIIANGNSRPNYYQTFTLQEIDTMKRALRAFGWEKMKIKIDMQDYDIQYAMSQNSALLSMSNKYKAVINGLTGQLFIGDSTFNPISSKIPSDVGYYMGTPQTQGDYIFQVKNSGKVQIVNKASTSIWEVIPKEKAQKENLENGPFKILVTDDPRLMIVDKYWKPIWDSKHSIKGLHISLEQDYKYASENGEYYAMMKNDGEFVVMEVKGNSETIKWRSGFINRVPGPYRIIIKDDGIMMALGKDNLIEWRVDDPEDDEEEGVKPFKLEITNNGILNLVDSQKTIIWTSSNPDKRFVGTPY